MSTKSTIFYNEKSNEHWYVEKRFGDDRVCIEIDLNNLMDLYIDDESVQITIHGHSKLAEIIKSIKT